jgi:hypothetical protein
LIIRYVFTLICFSVNFFMSFFCSYVSMRVLVAVGILVIVYQSDVANAFLKAGDLALWRPVVQSSTLVASARGV